MRLKSLADDMFAEADARPRFSSDEPTVPDGRVVALPQERAFAAFYRFHAPRLLRYFSRRVEREQARDLVHEAFANFLGVASREARSIDRPDAYLSRIASNLAAKHMRTAARRSAAFHICADDVALAGPDPQAHLEARDILDRLQTAMERLRPLTREIFMAHRLDGFTYREIAERTGLTVKRVEKHMSRAIAQLDDILGGEQ